MTPHHQPTTRALEPATPLTDHTFTLAENPLWDHRRKALFFTDIDDGSLHRFEPSTEQHSTIYNGPKVGGFTLERDGRLLLFRENDIATLDPDSGNTNTVATIHDPQAERFNDVAALPDGSALAGTIGKDQDSGALHRVTRAAAAVHLTPLRGTNTKVSNGIAITPDRTALFWTDTTHHTIWKYDLNDNQPAQREPFIDTAQENAGFPDGLTIDTNALLYSARWAGARVVIYNPNATPHAHIPVHHADNVTSACFGGHDLRTLFITTAGGPLLAAHPDATGIEEYRSNLATTS